MRTSLRTVLSLTLVAGLNIFTGGSVVADESVATGVKRLPWGHPDLQGTWTNVTITPLTRPAANGTYGVKVESLVLNEQQARQWESGLAALDAEADAPTDPDAGAPTDGNTQRGYNRFWIDSGERLARVNGEIRSSLIVDPTNGRMPYKRDSIPRRRSPDYDNPEARPLGERCIMSFGSSAGPPMLPLMYNNHYQIVQTPAYVMIMVEMVHDVRIIRLNDDQHMPGILNKWMGDSIGHWEGDTLVVETVDINGQQRYNGTVTERFTRVNDGEFLYDVTVENPEIYSQPWRAEVPFLRSEEQIYEYACHEGNYALEGILRGARIKERESEGKPNNK